MYGPHTSCWSALTSRACLRCYCVRVCSCVFAHLSGPTGANCSVTDITLADDVIAQPGFWAETNTSASPGDSSASLTFYRCPLADACLPGVNGSRVECAPGYGSVACSVCLDGYFEQFGRCVQCPATKGASVSVLLLVVFGVSLALGVVYTVRKLLPVDVLKLGLSMLQVRCELTTVV